MSYSGTVYCGYCGHRGHNRRSCPERKQEARKNPGGYTARMLRNERVQNSTRSRKCSYCREGGHNRATCSVLKKDKAHAVKKNKVFCEAVKKAFAKCGLGIGALIGVSRADATFGNQRVGMVKGVFWNDANFMSIGNGYKGFSLCVDIIGDRYDDSISVGRIPALVDAIKDLVPDYGNIRHLLPEDSRESHGWKVLSPISGKSAEAQFPATWLEGDLGLDQYYTDWNNRPERRLHVDRELKTDD